MILTVFHTGSGMNSTPGVFQGGKQIALEKKRVKIGRKGGK